MIPNTLQVVGEYYCKRENYEIFKASLEELRTQELHENKKKFIYLKPIHKMSRVEILPVKLWRYVH